MINQDENIITSTFADDELEQLRRRQGFSLCVSCRNNCKGEKYGCLYYKRVSMLAAMDRE